MNRSAPLPLATFLAILLLVGFAQAENVDEAALLKKFDGTGIQVYRLEEKLYVSLHNKFGLPMEIAAEDLALLAEVGPIETILIGTEAQLTGDDYAFLAKLKSVNRLAISGYRGDCGALLRHVGRCPGLQSFSLFAMDLKVADIAQLNDAAAITELSLCCKRLTPAHYSEVRNLKLPLESLLLSDFSSQGPSLNELSPLMELHNLKLLELRANALSPEESAQVAEALPECDVRLSSNQWRENFSRFERR
ncbi:hypothetical protein [Blastopirellula marina]|uniref:Leucine-rich repeat domain-containing protein n=1 Tax=Blastopirellula marina TaxID=124 RepID=A0A2S8FF48_9BACT|nr:hypothetical protein [Blastopirellula marina]PQO30795.1 hypothetical protein C5Y98_20580 [Blastopirellula marina]PTL42648.1 hypothetical protein C5Y97_20590 [Blastopirellula marina]